MFSHKHLIYTSRVFFTILCDLKMNSACYVRFLKKIVIYVSLYFYNIFFLMLLIATMLTQDCYGVCSWEGLFCPAASLLWKWGLIFI